MILFFLVFLFVAKLKANKTPESIRLRQLRLVVRAPLRSLYLITGISTATLSNIEKGSTSYQNSTIITLSNAFQVDRTFFLDLDKSVPSEQSLVNSLSDFAKSRGVEVPMSSLIQKSITSLLIDDYIENGSLEEFKTITTIKQEIKEEYGIQPASSQTSKRLTERCTKGILERRLYNKKDYEYRNVLNS